MDPDPAAGSLPSLPLTLVFVLASLGLVLLNAFFVAAEFAIVKVRRTRLEELAGQGVSEARVSILCVDQLDEFLSATQLGITLVSIGLGWIGEEAFLNLLTLAFPEVLLDQRGTAHLIAAAMAFFLITLLHVVLGELVPKSMAIQRAETITLFISKPLRLFYASTRPLIRTFTWLANSILKLLGFRGLEEPPLSEEELKLVMKESHDEGVISESEAQIINRAFEFSDKRIRQIMIPAPRVDFLSLARPIEENIALTQSQMRTRFPLCERNFDTVIGVVHMKDAWPLLARNRSNDAFVQAARPPVLIDAGVKQDQLMKIFREKHAHLAIVQNPLGRKNIGIVTLEDILEELVGEIQDEHGH